MKDDQGMWNFFFSLVFIGAAAAGLWWIVREQGAIPASIPLFDAVLLALAIFRLTRLFVYDKIMEFVRDWFLVKEVLTGSAGEYIIVRHKPAGGPRRTIADLLGCPWCFGVWAALALVFAYFATPYAWPAILVLALAGVGTFIQLLANLTGWSAEYRKLSVLAKEREGD